LETFCTARPEYLPASRRGYRNGIYRDAGENVMTGRFAHDKDMQTVLSNRERTSLVAGGILLFTFRDLTMRLSGCAGEPLMRPAVCNASERRTKECAICD
jgi:hypothetical protein